MTEVGGRKAEGDPSSHLRSPSSVLWFARGVAAPPKSVLFYVVFGTYLGIGALAHDLGFSPGWALASTVLIWAAPNQVVLVSALGSGAGALETAIAVSLSAVRLLPMVVSLLPLLRAPGVRTRALVLPAHFTAVSAWVVALQLLPALPRAGRVAFCNGIGVGFLLSASAGTLVGYHLAAQLPPLFAGALLFLTPISFFLSVAAAATRLVDRLALGCGLVIGPALALGKVELDLLWTGIAGGTLAYLVHRLRRGKS
jgi:predicted branched-subunit amino acid permease